MPETSNPSVSVSPLVQQQRNPPIFKGEYGQDPGKWLKEYERVAKYNRWEDMMCLANVYFFLDGTAKQWFENNEAVLTSWDIFAKELKTAFGDTTHYVRRAEEQLKCRAQKPGESTQSYIQSVLGLCHEANPNMTEAEKVSHLMKGVAEDVYQALVIKEITNTADFIKWCQHLESMKQKRIKPHHFARLPNVVPMASISEQSDLITLIRKIVREEVQRCIAPVINEPEAGSPAIEAVIREEVEKALAPVREEPSPWIDVQPRRRNTYADIVRRAKPSSELPRRKTDTWRTPDNRPVCFHCGRPGHVVRYCRERRAIFNTYRENRRNSIDDFDRRRNAIDDFDRPAARSPSPSPARGRSPIRRFRSPSPYRRSSQSPSRRNEEN